MKMNVKVGVRSGQTFRAMCQFGDVSEGSDDTAGNNESIELGANCGDARKILRQDDNDDRGELAVTGVDRQSKYVNYVC